MEVDANNEQICVEEEKCFENCAECTAGVCSICNRGYFFNLESTECVSDCGKGYYGDTAGYCVECDSACSVCTGSTANECTQCADGYEYGINQYDSMCVTTCSAG